MSWVNKLAFGWNLTVYAAFHMQLVTDVKERLENDHHNLRVGMYGKDEEDMILWFLKDRKFSVEDAVSKLAKAIVSLY